MKIPSRTSGTIMENVVLTDFRIPRIAGWRRLA